MRLTIDTETAQLTVGDRGHSRALPLYSAEGYAHLTREWIKVGWAVRTYFTYSWLGRPILQTPEDLVRLQEALGDVRPDVVVETGIHDGGSLLFHASICRALGHGRVVGIDRSIRPETRDALAGHPLGDLITCLEADSGAEDTARQVRAMIPEGARVLVILDSDHRRGHVARELELYAPLVSRGSYVVVADGIMEDLAAVPGGDSSWSDDNPGGAARDFLAAHPEFEERPPAVPAPGFGPLAAATYFPHGWLRRKDRG